MKVIRLAWLLWAKFWYAWAMREIDRLHPDVPKILRKQIEIEDKLKRILL